MDYLILFNNAVCDFRIPLKSMFEGVPTSYLEENFMMQEDNSL